MGQNAPYNAKDIIWNTYIQILSITYTISLSGYYKTITKKSHRFQFQIYSQFQQITCLSLAKSLIPRKPYSSLRTLTNFQKSNKHGFSKATGLK
jgi:hypothetical protein